MGLSPSASLLQQLKHPPSGAKVAKSFSRKNLALLLYSTILFTFLGFNSALKFYQYGSQFDTNFKGKNFIEKFHGFTIAYFEFALAIIYGYQLCRIKYIQKLLCKFQSNLSLEKGNSAWNYFPIFCWIVLILCVGSGVAENLWYEVGTIRMQLENKTENSSLVTISKIYFRSQFSHWEDLISAETVNPFVSFLFVLLKKWGKYAWLAMDSFVIILCRALAIRFQSLKESIKRKEEPIVQENITKEICHEKKEKILMSIKFALLFPEMNQIQESRTGLSASTWEEIFKQFQFLGELTYELEKYISPLIFL